jgi:thioredoxin 1
VAAEAVAKPSFDNRLKADILLAMASELNEINFQAEVLDCQLPVLVDFWSEQCGPCKQLAPVLDQLSGEMGSTAKIFKIDAVANMKLAVSYGVRSVPNLLFFKNGEVKDQFIGALITKDQLKARLEALM